MGSTSFSLICLALVSLSIVHSADALTCYECQWTSVNISGIESKEDCKDFKEADIKTCIGGTSCAKITSEFKYNGKDETVVERFCASQCTEGKNGVNDVKSDIFCCTRDKCNASIVTCASAQIVAACLAIFYMTSA